MVNCLSACKRDLPKLAMICSPAEMLAQADALCVKHMDRPDRSSIIRELLAEAPTVRKTK